MRPVQSAHLSVAVGLLLLAATAVGQAQAPAQGALSGTAVHSIDLPLPGTTVTITSSSLPTGLRSTVTDAQGRYQFTQLPPGSYELAFSLMGFKRLIVEGVAIPAGTRMGLNASMTSGPIEERQVVASDAVSLGDAETGTPAGDPNRASDAAPTASTATGPIAAPERLVTVLPRYPRDATRGTAGTVSVMFTLDAAGRPFNVQQAPEHDIIGLREVDGVLTVAPEPGQNFRTAVVDAVTQWVYAPAQRDVTLLVQFTFLAEGRVRLVRQHIVEPVQARLAPADRFQVGTTR
jgi:hypothetical protein